MLFISTSHLLGACFVGHHKSNDSFVMVEGTIEKPDGVLIPRDPHQPSPNLRGQLYRGLSTDTVHQTTDYHIWN